MFSQRFFTHDYWFLLYSRSFDFGEKQNFKTYKKILPPKDRYWADPFVVEDGGEHLIFLEEFPFDSLVGHISYIKVDAEDNVSEPKILLKKPYHLSYPQVFSHDNNWYMLPESIENDTISLYKANKFPDDWEHEIHLLENVRAVDSTLYFDGRKWWLFTFLRPEPDKPYGLYIFYADELVSKNWQPHSLNPITTSDNFARPAGGILKFENQLYRPSQDCGPRYGYGFNWHRIIKLTETEYEEEMIEKIVPNWESGIIATHTFNTAGSFAVVDCAKSVNRSLKNILVKVGF